MVVEFIILVVLFDLYLLWRYNKGCIHWIIVKCPRPPKGNYNIAKVTLFQSLQVSCLLVTEARVALGYRLVRLLPFSLSRLANSRVHPQLDRHMPTMNQLLIGSFSTDESNDKYA